MIGSLRAVLMAESPQLGILALQHIINISFGSTKQSPPICRQINAKSTLILSVHQGADPTCINKDGLPVLHVAVMNGHADVIPVLVQEGADVNRKGPNRGNTALHDAISLGSAAGPVVDALLG